MFHTIRTVVRAADDHYVLLFAAEGLSTRLGPLAEYSIRAELARLGFGSSDIDGQIEGASMDPAPERTADADEHCWRSRASGGGVEAGSLRPSASHEP